MSVGKNLPHDSANGHVSGESIYIDDIPAVRGELVVDFFYLPVSHARVKDIDLSDAKQIDGVVGLYTHKDIPGHNKFGPITQDEVLLVEDEIMFMGHPLVVIAATSMAAVKKAKKAIKVDYELLDAILTIDEAKSVGSFIGPTRKIRRGNPVEAFLTAEHVLEGTFRNQGQDQFYLESQAAIVYPGEAGQLVIHSSTQSPSEVQEVVAHILGLQMNQVVCVTKRLGGGFGGKESQAAHPAAMAALVTYKTKRPTRIIYNKDQDMQVTGKRHPFQNDYKVAFDSEGRITALRVELFSDGGAANDLSSAVMARAMCHSENAYYLPHVEIIGTVCKTHVPPNTAFRGFGGPQGVATIENIMEEVAAYLNKDPLDVRRINLYGVTERNVTPYGQMLQENSLPEIVEQLERSSDYRQRRLAIEQFNAQSQTYIKAIGISLVKFGISFNTKFKNQGNALVNIFFDGTVQVSTGATEMGQGVNTNIQQLVAGEFDISPDQVIVMPTSTEKNNNTSATAASSGTDLNGGAAVNACRLIKSRLKEVAARHLAASEYDLLPSPTTIVFENNQVYDYRRPSNRMTFKQVVTKAYLERVSLGERGFYATEGIDFTWEAGPEKLASGNPFLYFTTGGAVCEVTIDRFTGELKCDRADLLMDIGRPINPGIARGQIIGAFVQGAGWVTTEDLRYGSDGTLLSHSPTTYKIPNIQDIPSEFHLNWLDRPCDANPTVKGSKAVGEPPLLLGLAVWMAVKNAMRHVAGPGRIPELNLPATNEEIVMRIAEAESGRLNGRTRKTLAGATIEKTLPRDGKAVTENRQMTETKEMAVEA